MWGESGPIPETTGIILNWNENSVSYFAVSSVHDGRGRGGGWGGGDDKMVKSCCTTLCCVVLQSVLP